jgi:RNA polymerase sigma-70 factor, ECF subfamily
MRLMRLAQESKSSVRASRLTAMSEPPDEVLVVAAILGDLEAFAELVYRYRAAVVRTAYGIVGVQHAEDVAQESLLLAFKALPSLEEPGKFGPWLFAITRHRALRFGQKERTHQVGRVDVDEILIEKITGLAKPLVDRIAADEEVDTGLAAIDQTYALVLRLRFIDEMPLKRIAAFLGVPVSTVKWRLHRGKELLRDQIELKRERGERWKELKRSTSS